MEWEKKQKEEVASFLGDGQKKKRMTLYNVL
jgi:hypothetical protein